MVQFMTVHLRFLETVSTAQHGEDVFMIKFALQFTSFSAVTF